MFGFFMVSSHLVQTSYFMNTTDVHCKYSLEILPFGAALLCAANLENIF